MSSPTLSNLISEAERCVACGLCLPHCPTYQKTGSEADSPRGRVQLMRAVALDILPNNARFKAHIDLCLSCRSCESACPNNVQYGYLADTTRALFLPNQHWLYRWAKPVIRAKSWQYVLGNALWFIKKIEHTFKLSPIFAKVYPLSQKIGLISRPHLWKTTYLASSQTTAPADAPNVIQLFLGCATNTLDQQTLRASIFVCQQLGITVRVPPLQTCCGSIARQMGDPVSSKEMLAKNSQAFDPAIPIVSVASGCGAGLTDYMKTHTVLDIHTLLARCDWSKANIKPLNTPIYVQDPCTLRNTLKGTEAVYKILNHIPQTPILPLPHNSHCCGGAGAYMLTQSTMANNLRQDKIQHVMQQNVAILATANIGCGLHIASGLREQNLAVRVLHPIQIMAQQMGYQE